MIKQNLLPPEFEDAMERSMLIFIQNEIPSITAANLEFPVLTITSWPNEFIMKEREGNVLLEVETRNIKTEGFSIGGVVFNENAETPGASAIEYFSPYQYVLDYDISTYCSSGLVRSKMDGKLRHLFDGLRRGYKQCPVYEFNSETDSATAFDTGCRIRIVSESDFGCNHAEVPEDSDYLSHWRVVAKCLYYRQRTVQSISNITITQNNP